MHLAMLQDSWYLEYLVGLCSKILETRGEHVSCLEAHGPLWQGGRPIQALSHADDDESMW